VLWGEAVVGRDDNAAGLVRQVAAETVVGVEVAENPPASVEIQKHGEGRGAERRVDAEWDFAARSGDAKVLDFGDRRRRKVG